MFRTAISSDRDNMIVRTTFNINSYNTEICPTDFIAIKMQT